VDSSASQGASTDKDSPSSDLRGLCRIAGIAAFILIVYSVATIVQMLILGGQPATAAEAFNLLQKNKLVGLLRLDLPTVFAMPLYYLFYLGLYAALRQTNRALALLLASIGFAGVTLALATPTALSMLSLSDKFASATSEAMRAHYLAAGESVLATDIWHGTGAIVGGVLGETVCLLFSVLMLRSRVFGRATAYVGIVTHSFDLAHFFLGFFLPRMGVACMAIAGPLYPVWFFLVGCRLIQISSTTQGASQIGYTSAML
jgi:hypothetical protein